jgi:hypothetical protein
MPKVKSEYQKAAGKLISAIQKEWGEELGESSSAEMSEDVMDLAHDLLQAGSAEKAKELLGTMTLKQYLGEVWVQRHPDLKPLIAEIESMINNPD